MDLSGPVPIISLNESNRTPVRSDPIMSLFDDYDMSRMSAQEYLKIKVKADAAAEEVWRQELKGYGYLRKTAVNEDADATSLDVPASDEDESDLQSNSSYGPCLILDELAISMWDETKKSWPITDHGLADSELLASNVLPDRFLREYFAFYKCQADFEGEVKDYMTHVQIDFTENVKIYIPSYSMDEISSELTAYVEGMRKYLIWSAQQLENQAKKKKGKKKITQVPKVPKLTDFLKGILLAVFGTEKCQNKCWRKRCADRTPLNVIEHQVLYVMLDHVVANGGLLQLEQQFTKLTRITRNDVCTRWIRMLGSFEGKGVSPSMVKLVKQQ